MLPKNSHLFAQSVEGKVALPAVQRSLCDRARKRQAELIAQSCLDLDPQDKDKAIADRLRFDVRKWYVGKLLPALYGDKPAQVNVAQVQAVITPAQLEELRGKLEETREALREKA